MENEKLSCEVSKCEDIVEVKTEMKTLKEKIESLSSIEQAITRLTTLMEFQTKDNERRDEIISKQSDNLSALALTLEKLNTKIDKNDKYLEELGKKLDDQKDKGSISFNEILRYALFTMGGAIITFVVQGFLK